jgi:predicted lipoprotein with Yx(FWY)xxD motif
MGVGKHRRSTAVRWLRLRLRVAGALLLAVSACIHLYLYLTGYRTIPTIGWLFLMQVIVASVLTVAALVTHSRPAAAASAGFALSTLSAYLVAVWIGLFGFKEVRTRAGLAAGLIEVAAFALLALAAITVDPAAQPEKAERPARRGARLLARTQAAVAMVVGTVGAVSVAALVLLGFAVANAESPPVAAASTGMTLKATTIRGVTVLTNARGYTLYWFAPDTSAASRCTGGCTAYWPPVTGAPKAGAGVTGRLGTITRPDGGVQATYDGHPLYTYVGDSGPGQANGNNIDLNGGFWYEVRVSG